MKKTKRQNGITLVALVITIIILLILATISIQSLTNTGLFKKAQEAKEKTQNATENQAKTLNEYEDELNKYISGTISKQPVKKVEDNIGSVLSTTDNTELQDAYGNKIVVPAGFKIVSNSDTNNATTVDKGIVIEDVTTGATAGSQFVWVPVGKIFTDVAKTEANAKTITLGRYEFDSDGVKSAYSGSFVEEDVNDASTLTNTENKAIAKNITNFKNSVSSNGGYYIGRYEARTTTERTAADNALTQITEKGTDQVYNFVTQLQAGQLAQNMYNSSKFTSDLMNSYAWDTATLFIQECTNQKKYSRQIRLSSILSQTGTNTQENKDGQCNVYDMSSNVAEWTTETADSLSQPCSYRGGSYDYPNIYTSFRDNRPTSGSSARLGFRPILFLNI